MTGVAVAFRFVFCRKYLNGVETRHQEFALIFQEFEFFVSLGFVHLEKISPSDLVIIIAVSCLRLTFAIPSDGVLTFKWL